HAARVPGEVKVEDARLGDRRNSDHGHQHHAENRVSFVHVASPNSASMRARSNPSSSRPRTSITGTRSVGMPILAALAASSPAASASRSMYLSANGILRLVRYSRAARQAPHHEVP